MVLAAALATAPLATDARGKPAAAPEKVAPRFEPIEVVSTVEPVYPANVVSWGTVILQLTVDEAGALDGIKVLRDVPPFTEEAQRAVKKWKFRAARLDDEPVRSSVIVVFSFPPRPVG